MLELPSSNFFNTHTTNSVMAKRNGFARNLLRRREFLSRTTLALAGMTSGSLSRAAETISLPFTNGERPLVKFPQKRPLILVTTRPPQLETPFSVFNDGLLTPNDAFFVRYHLPQVPTSIAPETFRLAIKGKVNSPLTLSLADLQNKFEAIEIVAVNQCSGNGRAFFTPR